MEISKHLHYAQYRAWFSYADTGAVPSVAVCTGTATCPDPVAPPRRAGHRISLALCRPWRLRGRPGGRQESESPSLLLADSDGKITGADSKALFPRSRLPQKTLAAVWQLCDDKRQGALEMADFVKAMELISLAQAGEAVTDEQWLISSPVRARTPC